MVRLSLLHAVALGLLLAAHAHAISPAATSNSTALRASRHNVIMELQKYQGIDSDMPYELLQAGPLETLRFLTVFAVSQTPVIGAFLGTLVHIFFPRDAQENPLANIWEQVKDQVQEAIDASILEAKLETLTADFHDIQENMEYYNIYLDEFDFDEHPINSEAGAKLASIIEDCSSLMRKLSDEDDRHLFVALALPTAIAHLTALKERYHFGTKLFTGGQKPIWRTDLEDHIAEYTEQLADTMDEWTTWRLTKIRSCSRGEVTDTECCHWFFCTSACPSEYRYFGAVSDEVIESSSDYNDCERSSQNHKIVWERTKSNVAAGSGGGLGSETAAKRIEYHGEVNAEFREAMDSRNDLYMFGISEPLTIGGHYRHESVDSIASQVPNADTWEVCQEACGQYSDCNTWIWRNAGHATLPNTCSLARAAGEFVPGKTHFSCPTKLCHAPACEQQVMFNSTASSVPPSYLQTWRLIDGATNGGGRVEWDTTPFDVTLGLENPQALCSVAFETVGGRRPSKVELFTSPDGVDFTSHSVFTAFQGLNTLYLTTADDVAFVRIKIFDSFSSDGKIDLREVYAYAS